MAGGKPAALEGLIVSEPILMYVTGWCPYCARARSLLEKKAARFEEINIEERPEARAEMMARSGRRSVPQIFIGDTHIGGSDELYALDAAGGLDPLLKSGANNGE
jgi:glutaredoxin 3